MDKRSNLCPLTLLKNGSKARIAYFVAGAQAEKRLRALGLAPGKEIVKVSGLPFHGPVVININHSQVALGYGLAQRVMVEVLDESTPGR
ncbi:FeoA family protein [Ammonifex thiophilus]|uniref:Ferrous iron transport protein A n=1 Tax=Ammonifex thiophilus TaxID=444093 RepID=A0A3D8P1J1_9THEO|nr:FeoA family protein [Ammonifex thiophilus]RDV81715.1 ferrous iron transport protein A [Ammonifex thiophilus]